MSTEWVSWDLSLAHEIIISVLSAIVLSIPPFILWRFARTLPKPEVGNFMALESQLDAHGVRTLLYIVVNGKRVKLILVSAPESHPQTFVLHLENCDQGPESLPGSCKCAQTIGPEYLQWVANTKGELLGKERATWVGKLRHLKRPCSHPETNAIPSLVKISGEVESDNASVVLMDPKIHVEWGTREPGPAVLDSTVIKDLSDVPFSHQDQPSPMYPVRQLEEIEREHNTSIGLDRALRRPPPSQDIKSRPVSGHPQWGLSTKSDLPLTAGVSLPEPMDLPPPEYQQRVTSPWRGRNGSSQGLRVGGGNKINPLSSLSVMIGFLTLSLQSDCAAGQHIIMHRQNISQPVQDMIITIKGIGLWGIYATFTVLLAVISYQLKAVSTKQRLFGGLIAMEVMGWLWAFTAMKNVKPGWIATFEISNYISFSSAVLSCILLLIIIGLTLKDLRGQVELRSLFKVSNVPGFRNPYRNLNEMISLFTYLLNAPGSTGWLLRVVVFLITLTFVFPMPGPPPHSPPGTPNVQPCNYHPVEAHQISNVPSSCGHYHAHVGFIKVGAYLDDVGYHDPRPPEVGALTLSPESNWVTTAIWGTEAILSATFYSVIASPFKLQFRGVKADNIIRQIMFYLNFVLKAHEVEACGRVKKKPPDPFIPIPRQPRGYRVCWREDWGDEMPDRPAESFQLTHKYPPPSECVDIMKVFGNKSLIYQDWILMPFMSPFYIFYDSQEDYIKNPDTCVEDSFLTWWSVSTLYYSSKGFVEWVESKNSEVQLLFGGVYYCRKVRDAARQTNDNVLHYAVFNKTKTMHDAWKLNRTIPNSKANLGASRNWILVAISCLITLPSKWKIWILIACALFASTSGEKSYIKMSHFTTPSPDHIRNHYYIRRTNYKEALDLINSKIVEFYWQVNGKNTFGFTVQDERNTVKIPHGGHFVSVQTTNVFYYNQVLAPTSENNCECSVRGPRWCPEWNDTCPDNNNLYPGTQSQSGEVYSIAAPKPTTAGCSEYFTDERNLGLYNALQVGIQGANALYKRSTGEDIPGHKTLEGCNVNMPTFARKKRAYNSTLTDYFGHVPKEKIGNSKKYGPEQHLNTSAIEYCDRGPEHWEGEGDNVTHAQVFCTFAKHAIRGDQVRTHLRVIRALGGDDIHDGVLEIVKRFFFAAVAGYAGSAATAQTLCMTECMTADEIRETLLVLEEVAGLNQDKWENQVDWNENTLELVIDVNDRLQDLLTVVSELLKRNGESEYLSELRMYIEDKLRILNSLVDKYIDRAYGSRGHFYDESLHRVMNRALETQISDDLTTNGRSLLGGSLEVSSGYSAVEIDGLLIEILYYRSVPVDNTLPRVNNLYMEESVHPVWKDDDLNACFKPSLSKGLVAIWDDELLWKNTPIDPLECFGDMSDKLDDCFSLSYMKSSDDTGDIPAFDSIVRALPQTGFITIGKDLLPTREVGCEEMSEPDIAQELDGTLLILSPPDVILELMEGTDVLASKATTGWDFTSTRTSKPVIISCSSARGVMRTNRRTIVTNGDNIYLAEVETVDVNSPNLNLRLEKASIERVGMTRNEFDTRVRISRSINNNTEQLNEETGELLESLDSNGTTNLSVVNNPAFLIPVLVIFAVAIIILIAAVLYLCRTSRVTAIVPAKEEDLKV